MPTKSYHPDTKIVHAARKPLTHFGTVNTPIYQTSTVLFPTIQDFEAAEFGHSYYFEKGQAPAVDLSYGIAGTPTTYALAEALAALEGADHGLIVPSGLSAIAIALQAFLSAGDHVLIADSVYWPTRRFCNLELKRYGVETTYYDPLMGAGIEALIQPNTKVIFVESPGSVTFEVQDIPAISAVAKKHGCVVIMDNSWATPLYFNPFEHGVDVSLHAVSKYIGGHSDVIMGAITCNKPHYEPIYRVFRHHGLSVGPQECSMALRGLRTMAVRLKTHENQAMQLANWLQTRPEITKVLHPAFPSCPGHAQWKRDFKGSTGLFSVMLQPSYSPEKVAAFLNSLTLFGIGCSWGGFESLILRLNPAAIRTATEWNEKGALIRIYAGLEAIDDLMADLAQGFEQLR